MDELRLHAVAARVVAWHNRHPLARRITAAQVKSIGYVGFGAVPAAEAPAAAPLPAAAEPPAAPPAAPDAAHDEVDYEQAFAALGEAAAEPAAAVASSAVQDDAPSEVADEVLDAALDRPPAAEPPTLDEEVELPTATAQEAAALSAAAETAETVAEASAAAAAPDGAATAAEPADIAVAEHPPEAAVAAAPAEQIAPPPSLRDRLKARMAMGGHGAPAAVQGALVAEHAGYAPVGESVDATEGAERGNFMAPLKPARVIRWVARHGLPLQQPPSDGPLRRTATADWPGAAPQGTSYVLTAAIDVGALRSRVLIGAGTDAPVLGQRMLSLPRVVAAATLLTALLLGTAWGVSAWRQAQAVARDKKALAAQLAAAQASAASAAAAASAAQAQLAQAAAAAASAAALAEAEAASGAEASGAVADAGHGPADAGHGSATAPVAPQAHAAAVAPLAGTAPAVDPHAAHPAVPAPGAKAAPSAAPHAPAAAADKPLVMTNERPVTAYAQKGRLDLPARGPALSDDDKSAARQAVAAARAALGRPAASAAATGHGPDPHGAAAPEASAPARPNAAAALPQGPLFAVSTGTLRTRAEAEQLQAAMMALLRTRGLTPGVEIMPQGEDWRVVAWPIGGRSQAEDARALLLSRGMKVRLVEL